MQAGMMAAAMLMEWEPREVQISKERDDWKNWEQRVLIGSTETIFVVLAAYDWNEALDTIVNIFNQSFIPLRINIGVVANVVDVSQEQAEQDVLNLRFGCNVRVHVPEEHLTLGVQPARRLCYEKCFRGEKFSFFMHAHSRMCEFWDVEAIKSLQSAYSQGGHLVSQIPMDTQTTTTTTVVIPEHSTFCVLHPGLTLKWHMPVFRPRLFVQSLVQFRMPVISTKCVFAESSILQRAIKHVVPFASGEEDDLLISHLLFKEGVKAFNPLCSLLVHIKCQSRKSAIDHYKSKKLNTYKDIVMFIMTGSKDYVLPSSPWSDVYVRDLDVDVWNGSMPGFRLLGLTSKSAPLKEKLAKYGTIQQYKYFKSILVC